ncbi:cation:proton antiporter [Methanopyrus kandleri]|nr:sodium:proton antiporter [Methanopyrus kandleri]HII70287.1 sodium:proton antiporter [Methanopyrus kandleri]
MGGSTTKFGFFTLVGYTALLLSLGAIVARLSEDRGLPDIPFLLLLGFLLGPIAGIVRPEYAQKAFPFVGTLGLIIILLDGGFEIGIDVLRRVASLVAKLDSITLLITAGISSLIFNLVFGLKPFSPIGFLYGSITCATDPATLIPVFSKVELPINISTALIAESVFNDPLGVVLTKMSLSVMGLSSHQNPILLFISLAAGGAALGLATGVVLERLLAREPFGEYVVPITLGAALALWYICEELLPGLLGYELSGFMAVAVLGMYLGNNLIKHDYLKDDRTFLKDFFEELSTVVRIMVFTLLGACVSISLLKTFWLKGLVCALSNVFIARPAGVIIGTYIPPKEDLNLKERIYLALEGPRGVVPAALVGTIYSKIVSNPHAVPVAIASEMPPKTLASAILVTTFLTIFISVVLEATWAQPLAKRLLKEE